MSYLTDYKNSQQSNGQCFEYTAEQIAQLNTGANIEQLEPVPVDRETLNDRKYQQNVTTRAMSILYKIVHTSDPLNSLDIYKLAIDAEQDGTISASDADLLIIRSALVAEIHNSNNKENI